MGREVSGFPFDIEIKPIKLVRGQGLAKLAAEDNCKVLGINFVDINAESMQYDISTEKHSHNLQVSPHLDECDWYINIIYFL